MSLIARETVEGKFFGILMAVIAIVPFRADAMAITAIGIPKNFPSTVSIPAWTHIKRYRGPLSPSRGVHRGPMTSVALQSIQFAELTISLSPSRS